MGSIFSLQMFCNVVLACCIGPKPGTDSCVSLPACHTYATLINTHTHTHGDRDGSEWINV